jgi:ATP-binding cassette subfamily A (ABC1) protein 3
VGEKYKEMEASNKTINIRRLNKTYDELQAVNNLNVTMYTDQIFVLLGHNGAGKTTTISILTGMIEPTSGFIEVLGATELTDIRAQLGVCPQHDTLYDELTVEEHLRLYGTFRGLEGDELEEEIKRLIKDVNLVEKKWEYAKNLSGGQRRRLSVSIAFSGGAKVIILDEPTSGMDTSARRYIW